jgi:hypothetical protein
VAHKGAVEYYLLHCHPLVPQNRHFGPPLETRGFSVGNVDLAVLRSVSIEHVGGFYIITHHEPVVAKVGHQVGHNKS